MNELEKNLDNLIHLTDLLIDEYKLGTFTTKFSWTQIFQFVKEPYLKLLRFDLYLNTRRQIQFA